MAARSYLAPALELTEAAGYAEPGVLRFQHDAAEALVLLGELEQASQLAEQLETRGRSLGRPWAVAAGARSAALVAAASGDLAAATEAIERALAEHERLPQPFEFARTLLVLGGVQRRQRQKRLARETLGRALETFQRLGTPLWAEKTRDELRRIGGRPAAPAELTPVEERVARLAAGGCTNREIADALFMSVKTVERHLSHAFGKLGVSSRRELRSRLAAA